MEKRRNAGSVLQKRKNLHSMSSNHPFVLNLEQIRSKHFNTSPYDYWHIFCCQISKGNEYLFKGEGG